MSEIIKLRYYLVAFIDIVGQRKKLNQLKKFPTSDAEINNVVDILVDTSEYVKQLRTQFDDYFSTKPKPTGLLDRLPPNKQEWLEKRNQPNYWCRTISDSFIITVPCFDEVLFGKHIGDIYSCLYGISVLSLWALTNKKPCRGGIDIALGTKIDQKEVYGPVITRAYELESKFAKHPRVVVGEGLLCHLDNIKKGCPNDNLDGRHTLLNIDNCKTLITKDTDGIHILDFMGEGIKSVQNEVISDLVHDAYDSVISMEKWLLQSGDDKLRGYYSKLREYCESRLSLWGIEPRKE